MYLFDWSLVVVIFEVIIFFIMCVVSVIGNILVFLVVYKSFKLWLIMNLYIIVLVVSDLVCVIVEMLIVVIIVIKGKWNFGDGVC